MTIVTNNRFDVLKQLLSSRESRFFSLIYTNKQNEKSKYLVHYNLNLRLVYERDIVILNSVKTETVLEKQVLDEMIRSKKESLDTEFHNSKYTLDNYYTKLDDSKSVEYHNENLYFKCFVVKKDVIEKGVYKEVKHSEKTLIKKRFEKMCKSSKIRTFKIDVEQISEMRINKNVVEIV